LVSFARFLFSQVFLETTSYRQQYSGTSLTVHKWSNKDYPDVINSLFVWGTTLYIFKGALPFLVGISKTVIIVKMFEIVW